MIRLVIVDDNDKDLQNIADIVRETAKENNIEMQITSIGDASFFLDDIKEGKPYDIFLLDMEIAGRSGIELARKIQEMYGVPHIIFITNHVQYSPEGYEVKAERFILKETMSEKLPEALMYAVSELLQDKKRCYVSNSTECMAKIPYNDIIKIEKYDNKYSLIYTGRGNYKTRSSLSCLIRQLDSEEFIFVNKGIIVNLNHINEIDSKQKIHLSYGLDALLSKSRLSDVKKKMVDYYMS